jgi:hypothetical protein
MSDLLNSASLVLIPSGYKEDVVYSAVPTDGSGDLSFTRASNGTRINSSGLVEVCPWNLLQYSEQIDNAVWTKFSPTSVTADTTTAPNGTATADTISTSATAVIRQTVTLNANETYTYSIYVKKISYDFFGFQSLISGTGIKSVFDLSNGTVTSQGSGHTASIESVGNGWYRCIITFNVGSSASNIFDLAADGTSATLRTFYAWGAQTNIGSTAKPYFPTTDRLNVPRLTYQNGGGGCPSLLLEKQSTNQIVYSQEMDNALWLKGQVSVTANDTNSPDGTQNADKVTNINTTSIYLYQKSQVSASTWSYSFYAKKGTNKYLGISLCSETYQATSRYQPVFNLDNGTLQTINQSGSNETNTSYSINAVGNGWYKITASFTLSAGADFTFIVLSSSNNTSYNPASGNLDWQNATIGDYYIWGVQGEASSYPTSYIPSTSASATRVADACSKTGISSLIGQTEGTVFGDFELMPITDEQQIIYLRGTGGVYENTFSLYVFKSGSNYNLAATSSVSNVLQMNLSKNNIAVGRHKVAFAYANNDFVLYVDGIQAGTQTSGSVAACSQIRIGNYDDGGVREGLINEIVLFKTRLTNAELASLTTL